MNNTIEQDDISTLERRIKELKSDNYNDQFLAVFKRIQAKLINHKKAIATLKVLESAEGLPEKKTYQNTNEWCDGGAYLAKGFNDCRDLCQIPYAKQILKNEELQEQLSNWLQLELDYNKRIKELEAKIKENENG